ncbi:MAG: nucleotidyltransferase [Elusimicrobia bacterium]|nr:nucleotidyltransferase [Elusimicrobiota bacterium]
MEIGKKIKEIRESKGWSQGLLAERAGLSQQHISLIENRKIKAEWGTLEKVLSALGCEIVFKEMNFKAACERRALQWRNFSAFEESLRDGLSPAQALAQAGALAQLFHSRQEGVSLLADSGTALERSLEALVVFLDAERLPYMVIGGIANLVWGLPRATLDIDVTIWVDPGQEQDLAERLAERYSCLVSSPAQFVLETRVLPLRVLDFRVDVIFGGLPYEQRAIGRAQSVELAGVSVKVCSPEDLIIHKIISERVKDLDDVKGIVRVAGKRLDRGYLDPLIKAMAEDLGRPQILEFYLGLFS